jgi:DNA-binding protein Fis
VARPLLEAARLHAEGNWLRAAARLDIDRNAPCVKIAELDLVSPGRK